MLIRIFLAGLFLSPFYVRMNFWELRDGFVPRWRMQCRKKLFLPQLCFYQIMRAVYSLPGFTLFLACQHLSTERSFFPPPLKWAPVSQIHSLAASWQLPLLHPASHTFFKDLLVKQKNKWSRPAMPSMPWEIARIDEGRKELLGLPLILPNSHRRKKRAPLTYFLDAAEMTSSLSDRQSWRGSINTKTNNKLALLQLAASQCQLSLRVKRIYYLSRIGSFREATNGPVGRDYNNSFIITIAIGLWTGALLITSMAQGKNVNKHRGRVSREGGGKETGCMGREWRMGILSYSI